MKFAGFLSIELSIFFLTGTGDYSERFETREFLVSNCWQVIRSNLFNEKVELENFQARLRLSPVSFSLVFCTQDKTGEIVG